MDTLYAYYRWFTVAQNIEYVNDVPAAHAMVTDDFGNNSCQVLKAPYINDCDYDAAGALLRQLYGTLNPPVTWDSESLRSFDQSEFVDDPEAYSLNRVGHVYVPKSCTEGATCRLHVAFHGCLQYQEIIGNAFFARAGYNEWAESNNIIVLYPQTTAKTYWGLPWPNPAGCWDWWGYTNGNYDLRDGVQIQAVKAMIDRLMGLRRNGTEGSSE
jgi:poly(3-hydroxybutyrate) depolymerase